VIAPPVFILLAVSGVLFAVGIYALVARTNLIKMVIGLELMGSSVSLVFITGGYIAGDVGVSQAVVFTLITIEAVVAAVALALVILARHTWKSLDIVSITRHIRGGGP
jgi:NADH:ubiquinone oxidoreductase subunit K